MEFAVAGADIEQRPDLPVVTELHRDLGVGAPFMVGSARRGALASEHRSERKIHRLHGGRISSRGLIERVCRGNRRNASQWHVGSRSPDAIEGLDIDRNRIVDVLMEADDPVVAFSLGDKAPVFGQVASVETRFRQIRKPVIGARPEGERRKTEGARQGYVAGVALAPDGRQRRCGPIDLTDEIAVVPEKRVILLHHERAPQRA